MANVKYYKILNFDLDTNMLKDIYYRGVYTNAYSELGNFLKKHNFSEHDQGSCYISNTLISDFKARQVVKLAREEIDWFTFAVKRIRKSNSLNPKVDDLSKFAQRDQNTEKYDELVRKTQESRRQKQLEALQRHNPKKSKTQDKSTDRER